MRHGNLVENNENTRQYFPVAGNAIGYIIYGLTVANCWQDSKGNTVSALNSSIYQQIILVAQTAALLEATIPSKSLQFFLLELRTCTKD